MRPAGSRAQAPKGRSQFRLVVIGLFSVGLLGGYLFLGNPHAPHHGATGEEGGIRFGTRATSRSQLRGTTNQQSVISADSHTPLAPQVADVAAPPPHVEVNQQDQRHPENMKLIMAGQSSAEEHKSGLLGLFLRGRFDGAIRKSPKDAGRPTAFSSTAPAASTASKATTTTSAATPAATATPSASSTTAASTSATTAAGTAGASSSTPTATSPAASTGTSSSSSTTVAAATPAAGASNQAASDSTAAGATAGPAANRGQAAAVAAMTSKQAGAVGCKASGMKCDLPGDTIHTLFTSNGSPYQNFQARIMVATWNLVRQQPKGEKLVAMTRILHRTTPDELMDEIDTFRANPLQPECDKWCWFPVADRANAFQQWLDAVERNPSMQRAPWLLLLETDYVWTAPLQAPGDAYDPKVPGLSFAFDYIGPKNSFAVKMLQMKCPTCDVDSVPNSGPAPVLARYEDFKVATPMWEELSLYIETHEDFKNGLGWVREMYAWDIAVAANRLNILNQPPGPTPLIAQPPHDLRKNNATMYHYTWGSIFKDEKGNEVWKFDKRFYTDPKDAVKVPKLPLPPPWREGLKLHDGMPITKELQDTLTDMIVWMNKGIDTLPDLTAKSQAH